MPQTIFIGVGSNIGDGRKNCLDAIRELSLDKRVRLLGVSALYVTSPVSPVQQADFINGAASIEWHGSPADLLGLLNSIEASLGRERPVPQGPRIIDLDILLYGNEVIDSPDLIIPHPHLQERKFAIIPCLDIEPDLVHPLFGRPLKDYLRDIGDDQKITVTLNKEIVSSMVGLLHRGGE
jgi:2-amino-4-hydroxy-6-hydroxymethyldihydropteridine diphosphokinase